MPLKLDYFYGGEAEQYSFYRIPKVLFTDQNYSSMTMEARVLYGLLLDRMGLSARNGWLDSCGRVFIPVRRPPQPGEQAVIEFGVGGQHLGPLLHKPLLHPSGKKTVKGIVEPAQFPFQPSWSRSVLRFILTH